MYNALKHSLEGADMQFRAPALVVLVFVLAFGFGSQAPSPRAFATGGVQGDVNCDATVNSVDALQVLRSVAGLGSPAVCLTDAGDVNCDGAINSVDSLRVLRYVAGLSNAPVDGCAPIGEGLDPPPTSEALIAQALADGEIDYETSLLYRAYALYDDPRLPDEYRSPLFDLHDAMELFGEIDTHPGLSQGLLDAIAPFRARPADPISIFSSSPQVDAATGSPLPTWVSKTAAGGLARVWMKDGPNADAQLATYANETTRVWGQLPGLIRYPLPDTLGDPAVNPDSAIDLYFVDIGATDQRRAGCRLDPSKPECAFNSDGYTERVAPRSGQTAAGYVVIDAATPGDALTATIAHELFHAGQFTYDAWDSMWLMDATATWGEFRVLQKLGVARDEPYSYLPTFFKELDKTLTRDPPEVEGQPRDLNRYGSWLYFYFASMEKGDGIVSQIWESAAPPGEQGAKAVDEKLKFDTYFDDFTVRNWNEKPPLKTAYRDKDDTFPDYKPSTVSTYFASPDEESLSIGLEALSAYYGTFQFDASVHKIVFDNKWAGVEDFHVWGIVKIGNEWKEPEDWTDVSKKEWCRDDPEQNVTELVIIVSNSNMTSSITPPEDAVVEGKARGCTGYAGTVTAVWTEDFEDASGYDRMRAEITANVRWEYDEEASDLAGWASVFKPSGSASWTYQRESLSYDNLCTETGAGVYDLAEGNDFSSDDYLAWETFLLVWQDPGLPLAYGGSGWVGYGVPTPETAISCTNGTAYTQSYDQLRSWFRANGPDHFVNPDGSLVGSYHEDGYCGEPCSHTWTWNLHRVGNPPNPSN
jgi:hypothetical protein